MKVSKNELTAALKKAFEALGFQPGDYYDAADMVVWLETHGFFGFDRLLAALQYLNTTAPVHADLVQEDEYNFVLDGKGTSVLLCGSEAVDLIRSHISRRSSASLELINCYNRTFIIQRLIKAAQHKFAFIAYWQQQDYCVKVCVSEGALLPEYQTYKMIDQFDEQSLRIFCSKNLETIREHYAKELKFGDLIDTYLISEMAECYKSSLEQGIEIEEMLWETLDDLVARVLVESTESSRAGAGA